MSLLRDARAPKAVLASYLSGSAAGAALLAALLTTASSAQQQPTTATENSASAPTDSPATPTDSPTGTADRGPLTPATLGHALLAAVPIDGQDPRVSGAYGSAHYGTWQFTAFLTWRTPSGGIQGGTVDLPTPAGEAAAPLDLGLDPDRLHREHDIGWSTEELSTAATTATTPGSDTAALGLLELQIPEDGRATLTTCTATSTSSTAHCRAKTAGRTDRTFASRLTDTPEDAALAVQRQTEP